MAFVAKKIFLTKGVGKHRERLSSFELALRNAGIAACNIVRVSSIFPPNCKLISRSEGLKHIRPGQVAFTVISENSTKEPHRLIAASIGLALPSDKSMYGYLSEHHSFGETEEVAGEYAEELAAEMLATTLNVEFDPDLSWDEKKEVYRISNKIVRTLNVTQSAVGDKRGLWTTVLGAAILVFVIPDALEHRAHNQRQRHRRIVKNFRKASALFRRHKFPPRNCFRICATAQSAPMHRLRTNSNSVVVAFQRQLAISTPRQQLRIDSKLLRPVARYSAANRKNPHALRRQHRIRKFFKVFEWVETQKGAFCILPRNLMQRKINSQLRIAERRHKHRHIVFIRRFQNSPPRKSLVQVFADFAM